MPIPPSCKKLKLTINNMRRGFTLVEIIIYLAIVSSIALSLVAFMLSVTTVRAKVETTSEVQENARFAMDIIAQKIRSATAASVAPGELSLTMDNPVVNPTVFDVDILTSRIRMREGSPSPTVTSITSDEVQISSLVFTNLTGIGDPREHIRIELTVRSRAALGDAADYSYSLTSAVSVRH